MRKLVIVFLLFAAATAAAQQQFHYPKAGQGRIAIHKDLEIRPGLLFDLYRPSGTDVVPLVVFANVGSPNYRAWPFYIGWAEAVADAGMAAVIYQATQTTALADFDALVGALNRRAAEWKIDASRIVVWSASANVQIGLPVIMDQRRSYIRGGVIYYGDATVDTIRTDLPVLFVRAGLDHPGLNKRIDALIARALEVNAPWTVENNAGGLHGFEVLNDNEITRLLIHRTLSFMKLVTRPTVSEAYAKAAGDATVGGAYARGDWGPAISGYRQIVAERPADGEANLRLGISLMRAGQYGEGLPFIEKAWSLGRNGPRDVALPAAEAAAGARNVERAVHWLDILLSTPFGPSLAEVRTSEAFAPVREDASFRQLLADVEEQRRLAAELTGASPDAALRALRNAKAGRLTREPVLLGMAYGALGQSRADIAVEVFRIATSRYPTSANAWDSLSEALEAAGRRGEALDGARKALELIATDSALAGPARENVRRASEQRVTRLGGAR